VSRRWLRAKSKRVAAPFSGVIVGNDLSRNGSRFLIFENRDKSDIHVGAPLPRVTLHGGEVVRLKDRNTGAC